MIVLDASIAVKLAVREDDSELAHNLWNSWSLSGEIVVAPSLFWPETLSVLRGKVHRGVLGQEQAEEGYGRLQRLGVELREPQGLYAAAWQLAKEFTQPTVYDCCYLALAQILECDFWTADRRLANAVRLRLGWVQLLGN